MNVRKDSVRVLIVDDSPVVREFMTELLADEAGIKVVGTAANGEEGVECALRLRPDLIIMDIEMPIMNGLEAIEVIMKGNPTPIMVVTSHSDARLAYDAVSRGALEVLERPNSDFISCMQFIHKIKLLAGVKVIRHINENKQVRRSSISAEKRINSRAKVVAIASSLGGPKILESILSELPADFPFPILIAQHISEGFAEALVDWLDYKTKLTVKVASQGEAVTPGIVLIAPPEYNMEVDYNGNIKLLPCLPKHIYHPSCDMLLSSVAQVYREGAIGIILTGMGEDGVDGMQKIKTAGGVTIAQNEQTSLIYNMPRLVIEKGLADFVIAGSDIGVALTKMVVL